MTSFKTYGLPAILFFSFLLASGFTNQDITLEVSVSNCEDQDSIYLFAFNGIDFRRINAAAVEEGSATFELPETEPRFYYVGLAGNNAKPIILGPEQKVGLEANCKGFRSARITDSPLNKEYETIKVKVAGFGSETTQLSRQFYQSANDDAVKESLTQKLADLDQRKQSFLEEQSKANPYLGMVVSLNTYLSFQNNGTEHPSETEYFAREFFRFVDWKDEALNYLPWVYESVKSYTTTLASVGLPNEVFKQYLDELLTQIPADNRSYQLAIGGILAGLQQKNHANYVPFARQFIEKYQDELPQEAASVQQQLKRMEAFVSGGIAPDFTMEQPDGTPLSLSDLQGKVLLIDFWASWCGPCRRENPNVVRMYQKYKDKGFDILGVSLDKQQERWEQAIEADGLTWHHVSDLKGWSNEAARMYGVRSIPHTVLLDAEGKIIARNLRGPTLEQKLRELFGE